MPALVQLATTTPAVPARGIMLLACIIGLGVVGIATITGLAIARHRHWQRLRAEQKRQAENPPVDPWEEAGRRLRVPDTAEAHADE